MLCIDASAHLFAALAIIYSTTPFAALEYLKTGKYPSGGVIGPRWIAGETIGRQLPVT